jgi:LPXTG-motif cell wall-anchored protein
MKKTLATLLVVALVASVCGMMFVSADSANLAAGKEVANATVNVADAKYCANLTDGVIADAISTDNGVWFGYLYNKDKPENANTAEGGIAIPTIDLGEVTELSSARIHIVDQADWGIAAPDSIVAQVSNDGENFTDVATVTEFQSGVTWVEFDLSGQSAQYVRLAIDLATTWFFLDEIEIYGAEAGSDEPEAPEAPEEPSEPKTWEDSLTIGEDGNASVEVPYGFTWEVNYVDGKIGGEDVTICTTDDAYKACNPNWAITILLEKQEDGTYVAVQNAIITPGSANAITVGENQIALVVHSSASNPEAGYENWTGKVVAMSVKAGDKFDIDLDEMTVVAVDPNAPVEPETPDEPSDTPDLPVTGDASVLVFAILGVLAIVGAAVVIKVRN